MNEFPAGFKWSEAEGRPVYTPTRLERLREQSDSGGGVYIKQSDFAAFLNLIEAAERMVNPNYDGWKAVEAHDALAEALESFLSREDR